MSWQTLLFACLGLALVIGGVAVRRRADRFTETARIRMLVVGAALVMVLGGALFLVMFARTIPVGL